MSDLELLLEAESRQKNEALAQVEALGERLRGLELQPGAQQDHGAADRTGSSEQGAEELLQEQLQAEAQQRREAAEKAELLELRLAELEGRLGQQSPGPGGAEKQVSGVLWDLSWDLSWDLPPRLSADLSRLVLQMRREFAESIQLCEALASEKVELRGGTTLQLLLDRGFLEMFCWRCSFSCFCRTS